jgi:hypothetical protein
VRRLPKSADEHRVPAELWSFDPAYWGSDDDAVRLFLAARSKWLDDHDDDPRVDTLAVAIAWERVDEPWDGTGY